MLASRWTLLSFVTLHIVLLVGCGSDSNPGRSDAAADASDGQTLVPDAQGGQDAAQVGQDAEAHVDAQVSHDAQLMDAALSEVLRCTGDEIVCEDFETDLGDWSGDDGALVSGGYASAQSLRLDATEPFGSGVTGGERKVTFTNALGEAPVHMRIFFKLAALPSRGVYQLVRIQRDKDNLILGVSSDGTLLVYPGVDPQSYSFLRDQRVVAQANRWQCISVEHDGDRARLSLGNHIFATEIARDEATLALDPIKTLALRAVNSSVADEFSVWFDRVTVARQPLPCPGS